MDFNFMEMMQVIPRCLISLVVLFLITKLIGKKQVSELSLFDYVIGISIGNFTAEVAMDMSIQIVNGLMAIVVFGVVAYLVSIITIKSMTLRRILTGVPTIIIDDGKIIEKALKKANIDINDLLEQLRNQGYFNVEEVSYAIMEANGKISVLPKTPYKPVTMQDMKLKDKKSSLTANVIIDGKYMKENISTSQSSLNFIKEELKKQGYANPDNILLATLSDNKVTLYEKNIQKKDHSVLE